MPEKEKEYLSSHTPGSEAKRSDFRVSASQSECTTT
jgi:hypothetical protein